MAPKNPKDGAATEVADEDLFLRVDEWREKWDGKWQRRSSDSYRPEPEFAPRSLREEVKSALREASLEIPAPNVERHMRQLLRLAQDVIYRGGGVGVLRARWGSTPAAVRAAILDLDTARYLQLPKGYTNIDDFIRRHRAGGEDQAGVDVAPDVSQAWNPVLGDDFNQRHRAAKDQAAGVEVAQALNLVLAPGAELPKRKSRSKGLRQRQQELVPKLRIRSNRGRPDLPWIDSLVKRLGLIFCEFSNRMPESRGAFLDLVERIFRAAGIDASPRHRIETYLRATEKAPLRPKRGKPTR
jgi:hypothetical protein